MSVSLQLLEDPPGCDFVREELHTFAWIVLLNAALTSCDVAKDVVTDILVLVPSHCTVLCYTECLHVLLPRYLLHIQLCSSY